MKNREKFLRIHNLMDKCKHCSNSIYRDNWEDIMKNKIKIPITLEMIENAAKVSI